MKQLPLSGIKVIDFTGVRAVNRALLEQLDPSLSDIGQRTACWNQLSRVDGAWRVDGYDLKPDQPRPKPVRPPIIT